jgi:hypothetical protein
MIKYVLYKVADRACNSYVRLSGPSPSS